MVVVVLGMSSRDASPIGPWTGGPAADHALPRRGRPAHLLAAAILCGFGLAAIGVTLVRAADDTGILEVFRNDYLSRAGDYVRLPTSYSRPPEHRIFARPKPTVVRRREPLAAYSSVERRPMVRKPKIDAPFRFVRRPRPDMRTARPAPRPRPEPTLRQAYAPKADPAVQFGRRPRPETRIARPAPTPRPEPTFAGSSEPKTATAPAPAPRLASWAFWGRTMCVRTCDGYVFPVGNLNGRGDLPAHQTACSAACPGAQTQLYSLPLGYGLADPGNARSVVDGSLYQNLRTALLFRKQLVPNCSCSGPTHIATPFPLMLDPTIRSGDVVTGDAGDAKVYGGTGAIPHRPRDLADYRTSPLLRKAARADVDRVVGTSHREAIARGYARSIRSRSAALDAPALQRRPTTLAEAGLTEIDAPAGTAAGVRAYQGGGGAGTSDPGGVRIISVR